MDMHITGKNVELSPAVREYISQKNGENQPFLTQYPFFRCGSF